MSDESYFWKGRKAHQFQPLDWPRWEIYDADGYWEPVGTIPQEIRWAQAELAYWLQQSNRLVSDEPDSIGLKSLKVGTIALVFDNTEYKEVVPSFVDKLVADYILATRTGKMKSTGGSARLIRT